MCLIFLFFFKQKTAYEMRISDWSSDVCSSDLAHPCAAKRRSRQQWERADLARETIVGSAPIALDPTCMRCTRLSPRAPLRAWSFRRGHSRVSMAAQGSAECDYGESHRDPC